LCSLFQRYIPFKYSDEPSKDIERIFEIFYTKEDILFKDYPGHGEERQREIACGLLTRLGYRAEAVSSGAEAVEYSKKNSVDLTGLAVKGELGK
jgi:hypothetical protein